MRIVVPGGYGNFGARICRALSGDPNIEVIATGRNPGSHPNPGYQTARLDLVAPDFRADLKKLAPGVVIHCAGPFQGQDYRVVEAAIAAGAHYIDLADGRKFVTGFAKHAGAAARAANLLAVSGASTLPALSSAVIDSFVARFRQLEEIQIVIAPGQRAPRGTATMAGVLSYAGRPFRRLKDGAWSNAWGWQELRRTRFAGFGTRWAAACDVPDLDLLPQRYPGVKTVEFRAALELGIQHFGLWSVAALRRAGVPLPVERWAAQLNAMASWLDAFGSERGGMLVRLVGARHDGNRTSIEWHLTADASHGPEIPAMAAILVARKLARGELQQRGAHPCMGFLKLSEFEPEFSKWRISTLVEENAA